MLKQLEENSKASLIITILIAGLIFWISSLTLKPSVGTTGVNTILYHIFAFFFFAFFLLIFSVRGKIKPKIFILTILISGVYGILDEFHQFFTPSRFPSFSDVLLDGVGILLASLFYLILIVYRRKNA